MLAVVAAEPEPIAIELVPLAVAPKIDPPFPPPIAMPLCPDATPPPTATLLVRTAELFAPSAVLSVPTAELNAPTAVLFF